MNPSRQPVEIHMTYYWENWLCDPNDPARIVTDIKRDFKNDYATAVLVFDEFGEALYGVTVKPDPAKDIIGYDFYFTFPGSPGAPGLGEEGFNLATGNSQAFTPGIDWNSEHYVVLPD